MDGIIYHQHVCLCVCSNGRRKSDYTSYRQYNDYWYGTPYMDYLQK